MSYYNIKTNAQGNGVVIDLYRLEWNGDHGIAWNAFGATEPSLMMAFFQASNGYHIEDFAAPKFVQEARDRDIRYGLYHFLQRGNILAQFDTYRRVVDRCGGMVGIPALDVELAKPKGRAGKSWSTGRPYADEVKLWLDLAEREYGVKPVIYTAKSYWDLVCSNGVAPAWTRDYPLWAAWWPRPVITNNLYTWIPSAFVPRGWSVGDVAMWQWVDRGRTDGYTVNDYSIAADWFIEKVTGLPTTPTENPDEPPLDYIPTKFRVITSSLRVRDGVGTVNTSILPDRLKSGRIVTVYREETDGADLWGMIGEGQWVAIVYDGTSLMEEV